MGVLTVLDSPRAKQMSTLSTFLEAALSWSRGERTLATLLLGAGVLAYRWSVLGVVAQLLVRLYRRRR